MKTKLLVFAMAFAMLVSTMALPTTAYAYSNDSTITIQGTEYSMDGLDFDKLCADNDIKDPLVAAIPRNHQMGQTGWMTIDFIIADGSLIKDLVFIFNGESDDATWSVDDDGKHYVEYSIRANYIDGGFNRDSTEGLYIVSGYATGGNKISWLAQYLQNVYTSVYYKYMAEEVCNYYGMTFDETKTPKYYLDQSIDGDITVNGAILVNGEYVQNTSFFKALHRTPLAKVMKGVKASPLEQVVKLLPTAIACLVGYVALRKALALLRQILAQA